MFIPPNLEPCTPAVRAGALSAGEEEMRRCARLRELDSDESEWTRVKRDGCGVNGTTGSRGGGFSRVVEEDEPVEDLVAVRLVVVLEPHATVRTKVLVGQAALGHCEERQTAQQDREVHPVAPEIFHAVELGMHHTCQYPRLPISRTYATASYETLPENDNEGQATNKIRHWKLPSSIEEPPLKIRTWGAVERVGCEAGELRGGKR